jgi:predicted AAA+ superfamily ATPase
MMTAMLHSISKLTPVEAFFITVLIGLVPMAIAAAIYIMYFDNEVDTNIHYYSYYDKEHSKLTYYKSLPFKRTFDNVYMDETLKYDMVNTINDYLNHSEVFTKNNVPRSLRFIISGKEGIGKTTLIEAITSEYQYGLIHFPTSNYSENMVYHFFHDIDMKFPERVIVLFNNIDFNEMYNKNKSVYNLISDFVIKNNKNHLFIFTFNELSSIPENFSENFHIHHHYHMEVHINYVMEMINKYVQDTNKLDNIKNALLKLNHKITPGFMIPYLMFNNDFQKSLDRFFKIIH